MSDTHRRALLSVHDKRGLVELARALAQRGLELVASGGTARALLAADLPVTPVEAVTGAPEMLDGRVKTLHPTIHAGILARRDEAHQRELADHGIAPIEVVACNLYPFEQTAARPDATEDEITEQIDIGGVTLLRAAAKNHARVVVLSDPDDYPRAIEAMGDTSEAAAARRALALKALERTAAYDAAICAWMGGDEPLPESLHLHAHRAAALRYGENPHQDGALYTWEQGPGPYRCHGGKALSYNNLADIDAAWACVEGLAAPAVAIIKHANPCGLAMDPDPVAAFGAALASDPVSAFGSVIAINRPVTKAMIEAWGKLFVEAVVAPDYTPEALERLAAGRKNCRVIEVAPGPAERRVIRTVRGGLLIQTRDDRPADPASWRCATSRAPSEAELEALTLAWAAARFVHSNAIVFARGRATVGVGAGQMNRVDAVRLAAWRAGERAQGAVMASDAFFPFPDGIEAAAEAGITAVVQPGGSVRDAEVIAAAERLGMAMMLTGTRHFLH